MSKFSDHVPLYRQEGILKRHGVELKRSSMSRWMQDLAAMCLPLLMLLKDRLLLSHVIQADETPVKQHAPGNAKSEAALKKAESHCLAVAGPILDMTSSYLSSDKLDAKLVKASVIAGATPRGLAAFAEKSKANEALIHKLLNDPALMKQMQVAGGARNGNYGLTMKIYTQIQNASSEADSGILQRLALGTALIQAPYHKAYGTDHTAFNPVKRFLAYQKAYKSGELDPAFPIFTTWECRFITNDPFSNAEIAWFRQMLRNYAPIWAL